MTEEIKFCHYFVDEAGDLTFFDKKGRIIVGQPGASRFFMVGVAQIPAPEQVAWELNALRSSLMAHPRFKSIPSMQPEAKKTAITFHAKDDHPEIRAKVFELIQSFDIKVQVAIRSKDEIAKLAKENHKSLGKKLQQNAIYDDLVKRLFKNLLHKADVIQIAFARRGKSAREEALEEAINQGQKNFESQWKISSNSSILIKPAYPSELLVYKLLTTISGLCSDAMSERMTSFFCHLPRNTDSLWIWTIDVTSVTVSGTVCAIY